MSAGGLHSVSLNHGDFVPVTGVSGAAVPGALVFVGGSDGTNLQAFALDTAGNQKVVGPDAIGAPPTANPVFVAGFDGTNLQALALDVLGRTVVVGGAADGTPPSGNPVLIAGSDGTNAQTILTDSSGRVLVMPSPTAGATTAVISTQATSTTSATLLASNASRTRAIIQNNATKELYIKYGATATTADYTDIIAAHDTYNVDDGYAGRIDAIHPVGGSGTAHMTSIPS